MLTVRFIGFFSTFRKGNIRAGSGWAAVILMAPLALGLAFQAPGQALAAQPEDEEPAMIYHGRDAEGNRIFGTDHRAAPSFYTDPATGDRRFQTPPPDPSASSSGDGPEYIFVAPEVYPGNDWQNGQRPPDGNHGKPGLRPGQDRPGPDQQGRPGSRPGQSRPGLGESGQKYPGQAKTLQKQRSRRSLGPPPGGYPPTFDRPPTLGPSFIPRDPIWPGRAGR